MQLDDCDQKVVQTKATASSTLVSRRTPSKQKTHRKAESGSAAGVKKKRSSRVSYDSMPDDSPSQPRVSVDVQVNVMNSRPVLRESLTQGVIVTQEDAEDLCNLVSRVSTLQQLDLEQSQRERLHVIIRGMKESLELRKSEASSDKFESQEKVFMRDMPLHESTRQEGESSPRTQEKSLDGGKGTAKLLRTAALQQHAESSSAKFGRSLVGDDHLNHRTLSRENLLTKQSSVSTLMGESLSKNLFHYSYRVRRRARLQLLRSCLESRGVKVLLITGLAFALVGSPLLDLFDVPDEIRVPLLDSAFVIIVFLFLAEILGYVIVDKDYRWSLFFWLDLVGTLSMVFDITFLLASSENFGTTMARTARIARAGVRAVRLLKFLKGVSIIFRGRRSTNHETSKFLSQRIGQAISAKVSIIAILLGVCLPLFDTPLYPTADRSMDLWADDLEALYMMSDPREFIRGVVSLQKFYGSSNYWPFQLTGFHNSSEPENFLLNIEPIALRNVRVFEVTDCLVIRPACNNHLKASISFDFTEPNRLDAGLRIASLTFLMLVMVGITFDLSRTLNEVLLTPLDRMLYVIRVQAASLCRDVRAAMRSEQDDEEDMDTDEDVDEISMLEKIIQKLTTFLREQMTDHTRMEAKALAEMDDGSRGVLMDMLNVKVMESRPVLHKQPSLEQVVEMVEGCLYGFESWDFDVLSASDAALSALINQVFIASGVHSSFCGRKAFMEFSARLRNLYNDNPYHCYRHALDVLHCVSRQLVLTSAPDWLSQVDIYALLVAALAHDIGHFGRTNAFLVECQHPMALRYNDVSPLENMHCSTLFELCAARDCDIFEVTTTENRRQARKVCIATILHTDNALHFEMVKTIGLLYEKHSVVCDGQAALPQVQYGLHSSYKSEVLMQESLVLMELILHFADVSNPLKEFNICKAWAHLVLEEFFTQGDEEKKLGLPIGMLNDREKVNRPGSQHGFIVFLVYPLMNNYVKLFPFSTFVTRYTQLASNLDRWKDLWVKEMTPSAEDVAKREKDIEKVKASADQLRWKVWSIGG